MSKHTPGPWEARRDPCHFGTLSSVVGGGVRKKWPAHRELLVEVGGYAGLQEQEANTHLIAAAPDLLEAFEAFVRAIAPSFVDCHANAVKAIAKAKGETA